eukprot:COSAG04_NODE_1479_length_6568_cov_94.314886_4_plen_132_part_01
MQVFLGCQVHVQRRRQRYKLPRHVVIVLLLPSAPAAGHRDGRRDMSLRLRRRWRLDHRRRTARPHVACVGALRVSRLRRRLSSPVAADTCLVIVTAALGGLGAVRGGGEAPPSPARLEPAPHEVLLLLRLRF